MTEEAQDAPNNTPGTTRNTPDITTAARTTSSVHRNAIAFCRQPLLIAIQVGVVEQGTYSVMGVDAHQWLLSASILG